MGGVFLCILFSILSILGQIWLNANGQMRPPYRYVSDSNELLPVLTAITSFMYFKNLHIKQSKWINTIAASTFGVLLIHANSDTMRKWLWKDLLDNASHYGDEQFWLYAMVAVISVFSICIFIDRIRILFIEKPLFKLLNHILPAK